MVTWLYFSVHNTTYYCFDPIINSAVVNVTCPPQYYVRIQNASIYRAIGVSSCQPDMNNPSGAVCSLFNGVNDFMQSLLNACSMKSTCAVMAYPPFPPVTNCSNAIGATYAQVTYRCEASRCLGHCIIRTTLHTQSNARYAIHNTTQLNIEHIFIQIIGSQVLF